MENGKIILNVAPAAVTALDIGNDHVTFSARFSGNETEISFPISAVLAIYAKENGQGMVFAENDSEPPPPEPEKPSKPSLKLLK